MTDAIAALQSLAQETRLAVFRLLVRQGPRGMAAGDIARALDVPAATMSFHLAHMARGGLINAAREGRSIVYSVNQDGMQRLLAFLMEDCCQGRPEMCGLTAALASPAAGKTRKTVA